MEHLRRQTPIQALQALLLISGLLIVPMASSFFVQPPSVHRMLVLIFTLRTTVDGKFFIYYAASSFGSEHSGIFLVSSANGLTGWSDHGLV